MKSRRLTGMACLLLLLDCIWAFGGCLGSRCGPDEVLQDNMCVLLTSDGGTAGDGGSATGDGCCGLGEACEEHADCVGEADLCVVMPGHSIGYCTIQDCSLEPDDCPEGYYCLDASIYDPSKTTICLKE